MNKEKLAIVTVGDNFWAVVTSVMFYLDKNRLQVGLEYGYNMYDEEFFRGDGWVEW